MKIKVLIVDDDALFRKVLEQTLSLIPNVEVVGKAMNGVMALNILSSQSVDLVLLDVYMPEMNGLETIQRIKKQYPKVAVLMLSGATGEQAALTIKALEYGALDFIPKPQTNSIAESKKIILDELKRAIELTNISMGQELDGQTCCTLSTPVHKKPKTKEDSFKCNFIAIGCSTGGPQALRRLIPRLPADIGCPIVIVQHMPKQFTNSLAKSLNEISQLEIKEAQHGDVIMNNQILLAPGGFHTVVAMNSTTKELYIKLNEDAPVHSCRPSVDVLFKSLAQITKLNVLSVVLTGMGYDGRDGVRALKQNFCYSLAQSQKSCVVYGMPRAVIDNGLADEIVDLDLIPGKILNKIRGNLCKV